MADGETGSAADDGGRVDPVRVFVSYAHDDAEHEDRVRDFWLFLRAHGVVRTGSGSPAAVIMLFAFCPAGATSTPGALFRML